MHRIRNKNVDAAALFRRRCVLMSALMLIWLVAALWMNFILSVPMREKYLELGRKLALHRAEYYAPRARLLDRNGVPLAWSERYFDLYCLVGREELTADLLNKLERLLGPVPAPPAGRRTPWKQNLTVPQILAIEKWDAQYGVLEIRPRLERIRVSLSQELREALGEVEIRNGRQVGVSGAERSFDETLAGTPGSYEVMLDRHRNWIPGTWKETRAPHPGNDVRLPFYAVK